MSTAANNERNLGAGLNNLCNDLLDRLSYAGVQTESRSRTILNIDSYDITVLIHALKEYMIKKDVYRRTP